MPVLGLTKTVSVLLAAVIGQAVHLGDGHRPLDGPAVFIGERVADLGRIREGEIGHATFRIENHGTEDLVIKGYTVSCGCTVVDLTEEQKVIPPNGSLDLTAGYDSANRVGRQRSSIMLDLNDEHEPSVTLLITAEVETLFRVSPNALIHLRSARRGMDLPPLEIFPTRADEVLEKLEVEVPPGLLELTRESVTDDRGIAGERLTFRVPAEMELGLVNGQVKLRGTVSGREAELPIRVTGQVVGAITVLPATIQSLSYTPRGRRFAPLTVAATNDQPFEILQVEAGPFVDVEYTSQKQGKAWRIRTTLREDAPDGPMATTLTIRTDNDGQPVLTVPVFVNVRPRCMLEPAIGVLGGAAKRQHVRIRLQRGDSSPLVIEKITSAHEALIGTVETDGSVVPNVAFVRVGIIPGRTLTERLDTTITLKTNIDGAEEVVIPVEYTP